jgi:hypothetical protein
VSAGDDHDSGERSGSGPSQTLYVNHNLRPSATSGQKAPPPSLLCRLPSTTGLRRHRPFCSGQSIQEFYICHLSEMARQLLQRWYTALRGSLENVSFIHLHYFYFCATCILSSIIFWGSSTPEKSVRFIDSLFLCVSAMTEAGNIPLRYWCSCHLLMTFQASTPSTYQNCKSP